MTSLSVAHSMLADAFPGTSVCIQFDSWDHQKAVKDSKYRYRVSWIISVLPGPNGKDCQQWIGTSLIEAVEAALKESKVKLPMHPALATKDLHLVE